MYYFLREENFNLEEYDFDIEVMPRFTKKEHEVLSVFVENFSEEDEFSEFDQKNLDLAVGELDRIIYSLGRKVVACRIYKENLKISKIFFNLFDIVVFEEGKIVYKFSNELRLTYKRGNFYSRVNILAFLQFKHSATGEIFRVILKENKRKGYVEYGLDEIKDLLGIRRDKYTRYYDIERKVFNPTIKDIEYGKINIWYEKIKDADSKNARVTGVRLHYTNIYHVEIHRDTNELLKKYVDYIEDFTSAYEIIYHYRKIHNMQLTMDYIEENLDWLFKGDRDEKV